MSNEAHHNEDTLDIPLQEDVTELLLSSYETGSSAMHHVNSYELPSPEIIAQNLEQIRALIYPGFVGNSLARATPTELREDVRERLDGLRNSLRKQLYRGIHHKVQQEQGTQELDCPQCAKKAERITARFLEQLVKLRNALALDVEAAFESDPAATGTEEIIFCYPGIYAISVYRIAHALRLEGAQIIPRIMTEIAHKVTGIDIHPGARIGASFFIDHGTGVVIGETTIIGDRVRIYQGVTLGAMSVKRGSRNEAEIKKRHPTIEDDVVLYAGATILGGNTIIGAGAIVGGNCWVTSSVEPNTVVALENTHTLRT